MKNFVVEGFLEAGALNTVRFDSLPRSVIELMGLGMLPRASMPRSRNS